MKIKVKTQEVEVKRGTSSRTNKPYEIIFQTGFLVTDEETRRINIPLRDGQTPYAPGEYDVSQESFTVGTYGDLMIGRLQLVPVRQSSAAAK